jgi:hypothetical protein
VLIGNFCTTQHADGDAGIAYLAPLLADFLALALRQCSQKSIEIGIALVLPVKLHAVANQPAGLLQQRQFFCRRKQHMGGG